MKPKLFESLMQKDAGSTEVMEKLKLKTDHPFLKRYGLGRERRLFQRHGRRTWQNARYDG